MSSRKDELTTQIDAINKELTRLRRLRRKGELIKEKERLTKLMADLILELSDLDKDDKDQEKFSK